MKTTFSSVPQADRRNGTVMPIWLKVKQAGHPDLCNIHQPARNS